MVGRTRTRVILVPRFSKSPVLVLVDPVSLQCRSVLLLPSFPANPAGTLDGDDDEDENDAHQLPEKLVLDIHAADDDDD